MCLDCYPLGAFTTESNRRPNFCRLSDSMAEQRLLKRTRAWHLSHAGPPKTGPHLYLTCVVSFMYTNPLSCTRLTQVLELQLSGMYNVPGYWYYSTLRALHA